LRIMSIGILALAGVALCIVPLEAVGAGESSDGAVGPASEEALAKPLTLDQCIVIALENHPTLHGARREVAGARAGIKASKAAALPQFGISCAYTQNNGQSAEGFAAAVSAKQLIHDSGRTTASIRDAKYALAASTASYSDVEQSVVLGVRQSYYGVLAAEQLVSAQSQARDLSELHLREAQARHNEGIAPKADVTKAEVEVSNARLALIRAENGVNLAYAALSNALGLPPTTPLELAGQPKPLQEQSKLEDLLNIAYRNRPELTRIEAQIQSAQEKVKIAGAATKPAVYLAAGDVWPRTISGIGPVSGSNWTVGVTVSQSIWDGGGTKARVEQAREAVGKLEADLANEKQQVGLEVQQAYLSVVEADQRVVAAAKLVEQAEDNHRIAQGRYEEGVGPMIDVVDAQTQLTEARVSYVQAQLDALVGRAKLDRATGRTVSVYGAPSDR